MIKTVLTFVLTFAALACNAVPLSQPIPNCQKVLEKHHDTVIKHGYKYWGSVPEIPKADSHIYSKVDEKNNKIYRRLAVFVNEEYPQYRLALLSKLKQIKMRIKYKGECQFKLPGKERMVFKYYWGSDVKQLRKETEI